MKKHHFITALLVTCMVAPVFSQDTTDNAEMDKREYHFHVSNFSVSAGVYPEKLTRATLVGFEKLAPNSALIRDIYALPDYNNAYNYYFNNDITRALVFNLGFDFLDYGIKNFAHPRLNLGLSYNKSMFKSLNIRYEDSEPYDTLSSETTNNVVYLDSVTQHRYDMYYYSEQIRLDVNFIYRSNPAKRFSFYAGAGITAGFSINAYSTISYEQNKFVSSSSESGSYVYTYQYYEPEVQKKEQFTHKINVGGSAYIPLGLDFRIGNKKSLWTELHLFIELRPGVNLVYIPELTTYTYGIFQGNFGVKYEW
ncbi:MAG: hypothetical protein U9Q98_09045 [Bacteroidota bacterium]|nr:hypothetical protein [Bacteroidota bacterium]